MTEKLLDVSPPTKEPSQPIVGGHLEHRAPYQLPPILVRWPGSGRESVSVVVVIDQGRAHVGHLGARVHARTRRMTA
jgi:hypothetical protein